MTAKDPIFKVTIDAKGVALDRIKRGGAGYRKAKKSAIMRQRDAIELFRKLHGSRKRFSGSYTFHFLDTARTFAMLCLQAKASEIQDNLNRVLTYDASGKASRR